MTRAARLPASLALAGLAMGFAAGWLAATIARNAPAPQHAGIAGITVLRHTYDGAVLIDGSLLAFEYGYDGMRVEMIDGGDGIFRDEFEGASTCP